MKRVKFTIAFDMNMLVDDNQDPEEVSRAYAYMIGLGENWRIIKQDEKTISYKQLKKLKEEVELSMGGGCMEIIDWEDIEDFFKED